MARSRTSSALLLTALLVTGCDRFTSTETRITRAEASLKTGEYQAALIDLRSALAKQPDNTRAQILLADALSASGDVQGAEAQLETAIAAGAPARETDRRHVQLLLSLGKLQDARKALSSATALSATERANFEGQLLLTQQRPDAAQAAFERALAADPQMSDAALGRIEAIGAQGHGAEALEAVSQFVARNPDSGRAWLLKGNLAVAKGDLPAAIEAFTAAIGAKIALDRLGLVKAHVQRIECYLATSQLNQAQTSLAELQKAAPDAAIVSLMTARVALAGGDASTAVNQLRNFTRVSPQYLNGRLLLASALLQQGSTEQALAEGARTMAEFGDRDEPRLALAGIQLRLGRSAEAEETLQPLTSRSPPLPLAMAMLAELRIRRGEMVSGVSLLQQSLSEQPNNPRLKLQLASAYLSTGQPKLALSVLDSIDDRDSASARDRLRVIAAAATQGPAAEKEIEAAVARHPNDADLLLLAAMYQASLDHLDAARDYMNKARQLRPNDSAITLAFARVELSAGRADQAESLARSALEKEPNEAAAMILMANIVASRGQEAETDAWLSRASVAQPQLLSVRMALAARAAARGKSSEARRILTDAIRTAHADPSARIALAELDASDGRYAEAMSGLREAAQATPGSPAILLAMAQVQLVTKDIQAARNSLQKALEANPTWLPAIRTLTALEMSTGNLPAALEVVRRVRRTDPNDSSSFALEGDVYMAAKRPADAATAYANAYRRAPTSALATRAAQAKSLAHAPGADAELVDWLTRTPNDAVARRTLAEYHIASGRNDVAIKELEQVVTARPTDVAALNNLAWLYQQTGNPLARSTAEKAYAAAPGLADVADTYGWILVQGGDAKKGRDVLRKAAEQSKAGDVQFHFASALHESGENEEAAAVLKRALGSPERFSSRPDAESLLKKLGK